MNRELAIILRLKNELSKELSKVSSDLAGVDQNTGKLSGTFAVLGRTAAIVGTAITAAAGALAITGIQTAATIETAQVGLETLLKSSEKAAKTIERLKVEAARTPFELPGLAQAVQLLTSVTKDGDKSIDIVLNIGEALAAMGKGQAELDRIIVNLQQIAATGKAATIDIKQFAFAGIPIYEMLGETTGKTGEELAKFIEDGGVTFELLTKMFDDANNAGGRFFNAFQNSSGTFNQSLSNLKDSWGLFAADIVNKTGIFDGLVVAMQTISGFLAKWQENASAVRQTMMDFFTWLDENTGVLTYFSELWQGLVFIYENALKPALDDLWEALQPFMPFLITLAKVFGVIVGGAIVLLVTIIAGLVAAFAGLITIIAKNLTNTLNGIKKTFDIITDGISKFIGQIDRAYNAVKKFLSVGSGKVGDYLEKGVGKILGVNDAIIDPNGNIITTHPDDYIIATKNPKSLGGGGGTTINITGNTLLDQRSAEKVGDMIVQKLRLNYQQ